MDPNVAAERNIPLNLYRHTDPLEVEVLENRRLTSPTSPSDVRHVVLRFAEGKFRWLEGQSAGIPPPGLNARGRPNVPRLYSIASDRDGEDGTGTTLALTVKRLVYHDEEGAERRGLSSNFLCDARPGDVLRMTGPAGKDLLLPDDPMANLLLIATGTGIAPFRAFWRRRYGQPVAHGATWLLFGVQHAGDVTYGDELEALQKRDGFRLDLALSREQTTRDGRRLYVQDRLREHAEDVWAWLQRPETYVYVCGIRGMEFGVSDALGEIAKAHGQDWDALRERMVAEERWHVEVY